MLALESRQTWKAYDPLYTFFITDMKKGSSIPLSAFTTQGTVTKGFISTTAKLLIMFLSTTPPHFHKANYACNLKLKQNKNIHTLQQDNTKKNNLVFLLGMEHFF